MTDWDKRFEDGIGELAPDLLNELVGEAAPETIGPYRLEAEIGRGGMGIVYRAQRDDGQFDQQVAIKLLPNAAPTADELRRFERERQILANLNHSGIARLYDGGVADDGRLYLVMELIEGDTLTQHLANHHQSQSARLNIFEQIVAAVAHAQQQLIVHCDLKPSNILVTAQGEVKLLDFGVARVLEQSLAPDPTALADAQATTSFNYQPLTPSYAAPEHLDARPLGMYTDVYQLGLILFRLLSDHDFREASSATPVELAHEIAQADQQQIESLRRSLDSDLLAVLLKSTALDPQSRYPSAVLLLEDVHRYQRGFAVSAHLPSRWHRLKKWARRRPATAIAVSTLSAASIAFVALLVVQERRVSAERAIAVSQAQSAESVVDYLASILDANATERGGAGPKITVYEMLLKSEASLPEKFAEQPIVRERLHRQHATSFYLTNDHKRAISNAEAAIAAFAEAPSGAIAQASLAENYYILGKAQLTSGQQDEGLINHKQAIAIVEASDNPDPEYLVELRFELGSHYLMTRANPSLAMPYISPAAAFFADKVERNPGPESYNEYVYVLRQRAVAYVLMQQYSLALEDLNTSIDMVKKQFGKISVTDVLIREKGRALTLLGKTKEALQLLEPAYVDITTNQAVRLHASIQMLKGQALLIEGLFPSAVELLEAALAGWIEHSGANMVAVPGTQHLLALARLGAGDRVGARQDANRALELGMEQNGESDHRIADYMVLVGDLAADPQEMLSLYQRAKKIRSTLLPADDWRNAEIEALLLLANAEAKPEFANALDEQQVRDHLAPLLRQEGIVPRQRAAQLQQRLAQLTQ
ncbi:MAG: protein kinase [Pseudomonadales bacterium]